MEGFGGLVGSSAPRQQGERNLALRTNQRPSANGGCHPRNRNRIANTNVGGQARNFKGSFTQPLYGPIFENYKRLSVYRKYDLIPC